MSADKSFKVQFKRAAGKTRIGDIADKAGISRSGIYRTMCPDISPTIRMAELMAKGVGKRLEVKLVDDG